MTEQGIGQTRWNDGLTERRHASRLRAVHIPSLVVSSPRATRHTDVVSKTDVQSIPETFDEQSTDVDHPWVVIVWNDPINLMSYVTFVLQKVFGYDRDKATKLMLDVHHKGRAVVSSGTRERSELDVYRLHEHGLWATMQRDDV